MDLNLLTGNVIHTSWPVAKDVVVVTPLLFFIFTKVEGVNEIP